MAKTPSTDLPFLYLLVLIIVILASVFSIGSAHSQSSGARCIDFLKTMRAKCAPYVNSHASNDEILDRRPRAFAQCVKERSRRCPDVPSYYTECRTVSSSYACDPTPHRAYRHVPACPQDCRRIQIGTRPEPACKQTVNAECARHAAKVAQANAPRITQIPTDCLDGKWSSSEANWGVSGWNAPKLRRVELYQYTDTNIITGCQKVEQTGLFSPRD